MGDAKITLEKFIKSISNMEKKTDAQAIKESESESESEDDYNELLEEKNRLEKEIKEAELNQDKEKLTKLLAVKKVLEAELKMIAKVNEGLEEKKSQKSPEELFNIIDANKDNFLTTFELANFLVVQGQATTQEEAIKFLSSTSFSTNPDAKITLEKFIKSISNMEKKQMHKQLKNQNQNQNQK